MPHFGPFLKRAALVEKIRPVWPALTYCCHTSILTGCYVERHGIVHNENMHRGGHLGEPWFSMKRDVKCLPCWTEPVKRPDHLFFELARFRRSGL